MPSTAVTVPHPPAIRPKVRARRGQATDPHSIPKRNIDHNMDQSDEQKAKKQKVVVGCHLITIATLVAWWHEKHIVREPSFDFKLARKIYLRRLYYGNDRVCKEQL